MPRNISSRNYYNFFFFFCKARPIKMLCSDTLTLISTDLKFYNKISIKNFYGTFSLFFFYQWFSYYKITNLCSMRALQNNTFANEVLYRVFFYFRFRNNFFLSIYFFLLFFVISKSCWCLVQITQAYILECCSPVGVEC